MMYPFVGYNCYSFPSVILKIKTIQDVCAHNNFVYNFCLHRLRFKFLHFNETVDCYTPVPRRGRGYTVLPLSVCPSFRPSKKFFVALFSLTVDGRNLIFGHKRHIGIPYCGKHFWTHQIPTSCLPT